ncbi:MAG: helix-turn-helix transcriptional regulator [Deltaproteobacteria bacterium]|nr:helix-turn-helix transcriptional regulator [Deltaproteobacteria bacterium]
MNRLREVRVVRRITQFSLYERTGINTAKISYIENGLIEATKEEKEKFATALCIPINEIFGILTNETK